MIVSTMDLPAQAGRTGSVLIRRTALQPAGHSEGESVRPHETQPTKPRRAVGEDRDPVRNLLRKNLHDNRQ